MSESIRVAVVTGGHSYDVPNFHRLFRALDGVDAYIQHMQDFASAKARVVNLYDAVVFYTMLKEGPSDEGQPWYTGKPVQTMDHWLKSGKGIVMLHHAILAYPDWDPWVEMVGVEAGSFEDFSHGEQMRIQVVDGDHPITQGMTDWEMIDETYVMGEPDEDSHVLLTTDHAECMKTIGWVRDYNGTRVFNLQSGHDNETWGDDHFRKVLTRGIEWAAGRI